VEIEEEEQTRMLIDEKRDTMEPVYHRGVTLGIFRDIVVTGIFS
jgi:hypothetical protein